MFKKPFKVKFNDQLKSSDKKKLLTRLKLLMPRLNDEPEIFNAKDSVTVIKVTTHGNATVIVYRLNSTPIFFEVEDVIYPTVYTLWQHPSLLQSFVTYEAVIDKLANGADLMQPGVAGIVFAAVGEPHVKEGDPVSICSTENAACAAVGQSLISGHDVTTKPAQTGKAVRVLHVRGDHLLLQLMDIVPDRPMISHQVLSHEEESPGEDVSNSLSLVEQTNLPETELAELIITEQITDELEEPQSNCNVDVEPDVNQIADYCLLKALLHKKLTLPVLANIFYKNCMLIQVPEGLELNIKKTKHKKLSVMLKAMSALGVLEVVDEKGVQSITSINFTHPYFKEVQTSPWFQELERRKNAAPPSTIGRDDSEPSASPWERPVEIKDDLLIVNKVVLPLFSRYDFKKGDTILCKQAREVIVSYVKKNGSTDPITKNVTIDPILADILGTRQTLVPWSELVSRTIDKMGSFYQIKTSKGRILSGKGRMPNIEITTATRSGNKMVTLVNNLEKYGINVDECAKHCQHTLAASATSHANSASTTAGLVLQVQGNQKASMSALLVERYGVPKAHILGFVEKKTKKKLEVKQ